MMGPEWLDDHRRELDAVITFVQRHTGTIEDWAADLAGRLDDGARLLAAGNGGSAAEAQHLTSELVGRFLHDRRSFSAISLCAETSTLSAIVNDYGADDMFARQVEGHGRPGDVLVLLSTSGASTNVLRAAERGVELGLRVWGLTGPAPNPLATLCHEALCIDAPSTAAIQEGHLMVIHALCAAFDARLGVGRSMTSEASGLPERRADPGETDDRPHIVVVGDVLADEDITGEVHRLAPDAPAPVLDVREMRRSPGGAGLAALLCTGRVTLIAPIADDEHGDQLAADLERSVHLVRLPHEGGTRRKTRVRTQGRSLVRLDQGGSGRPLQVPQDQVAAELASADAVLVSDYGAGTTHDPHLRRLLTEAAGRTHLVWDPHPRGGAPVPGATLVTPNVAEARAAVGAPGAAGAGPSAQPGHALAGALRSLWKVRAVCVTAGRDGAYLAAHDDQTSYFPAVPVDGGDPCGAGDRFAACVVSALGAGALLSVAVEEAAREATGWVGAGGAEAFRAHQHGRSAPAPVGATIASATAATPTAPERRVAASFGTGTPVPLVAEPETLRRLATDLRADGSTIVATGGCFDLIHAGHVATLQAARRLGDRLVVLMNSDASVALLKGPGRPVVPAEDRARVLAAMDCVDAVVVFDDADPRGALMHLRPDVWAKGGDYGGRPLPETEIVHQHGGRLVLLPYLSGRSTTGILRRSEAITRVEPRGGEE